MFGKNREPELILSLTDVADLLNLAVAFAPEETTDEQMNYLLRRVRALEKTCEETGSSYTLRVRR